MKKLVTLAITLLAILPPLFAGGGCYYYDEFPRYNHIMENLYATGNVHQYIINPCTSWTRGLGDVYLDVGTPVTIKNAYINLGVTHIYDREGYSMHDENYGLMFHEYLCSVMMEGEEHDFTLPGWCISTSNRTTMLSEDESLVYMELESLSETFLPHEEATNCENFDQLQVLFEPLFKNPDYYDGTWEDYKRQLYVQRIYNTKLHDWYDLEIPYNKESAYDYPNGSCFIEYDTKLPQPIPLIKFVELTDIATGIVTEKYTWFSLNPTDGSLQFLYQCEYQANESDPVLSSYYITHSGDYLIFMLRKNGNETYYENKVLMQASDNPYRFVNVRSKPDFSTLNRKLEDSTLLILDKNQLRLLRNGIYARYGRPFTSAELKDYFSQTRWYKVNHTYSDDMLTQTDKDNIELIQAYEAHWENWDWGKPQIVKSAEQEIHLVIQQEEDQKTPEVADDPTTDATDFKSALKKLNKKLKSKR